MTQYAGDTESELIHRLKGFELNEEEEDQAILNEDDTTEGVKECQNSCYGRVLAQREVPLKFLKMAMAKAWRCESLKVVKISTNIYHIFAKSEEVLDRILYQGPWCLDNNLIATIRWERGLKIQDDSFNMIKFWFQVTGLPRELYTKDVGRKLGGIFRQCEDI